VKKSFWKTFREEVLKKQKVYVRCEDTSCCYNKHGNCVKCYPNEIIISADRKCMSHDFE
jgi:hypothetical protein